MGVKGPVGTSTRQPNRGKGRQPRRILPAAGRQGPPPAWPLPGAVPKCWAELWSLPQAVAWEADFSVRVVARYARMLVQAEKPGARGTHLSECRQMEDRLGLTPGALLRLEWQIRDLDAEQPAEDEPKPAEPDEGAPGQAKAVEFFERLA